MSNKTVTQSPVVRQADPRPLADLLAAPVVPIDEELLYCQRVENDIMRDVHEIRQLTDDIERLEAQVLHLKERLLGNLPIYQSVCKADSYLDDDGYARLIAEHTQFSYNAAALEILRVSGSPSVRKMLDQHRKEWTVRAHVRVK